MPITFTWDFNPATLLSIGIAALAVIRFALKASEDAHSARRIAEVAQRRADTAHDAVQALQASLAAYREVQAERLVSREVLREVEERLTSSIDRLGDRLDTLVKELVAQSRS